MFRVPVANEKNRTWAVRFLINQPQKMKLVCCQPWWAILGLNQ